LSVVGCQLSVPSRLGGTRRDFAVSREIADNSQLTTDNSGDTIAAPVLSQSASDVVNGKPV
jgi:hypothetical protein